MSTVSLSHFSGKDPVAVFAAAMEYLRAHPNTELFIAPGVYELTSEQARAAQQAVMTGAYGENPQKVMFCPQYRYTRAVTLEGLRGCTLLAYGATLLIDGFLQPLSVLHSRDIHIRGLTIDYKRKPYSRGTVRQLLPSAADGTRECLVEWDADCPVCEGTPLLLRTLFHDVQTGRSVPGRALRCRTVDAHHTWFTLADADALRPGLLFYTVHTLHARPAILLEHSSDVRLTDVTIHSQPGMGIVGNRCQNVTLTRLCVVPSAGQHLSTNTDATHFTSLRGLLRVEDCLFEGQGDDAVNVHAYYQEVVGRPAPQTYLLQEKTPDGTHAQTLDYPDVGDVLELVEKATLRTVGHYTVTACEPLPQQWMCRVTLEHPLPEKTDGLALADITRLPRLEFVGCRTRRHFARGVLVKTRSALIENCTFEQVQGPAVAAAAEAWWSEGVCPANIVIRHNRIRECAGVWGEASVVVKADCETPTAQSIRNIVIEHNRIDSTDGKPGIYARGVDGLCLADNNITKSAQPVIVENCSLLSR